MWNSVADLLSSTSTPIPWNANGSAGSPIKRSWSEGSFDVSGRTEHVAESDHVLPHSVVARLARSDAPARGQPVKENSPPLLRPNGTCRSQTSPVYRSKEACDDVCGNNAAPMKTPPLLLRLVSSRLKPPSRLKSPPRLDVPSVGHPQHMGLFSLHGCAHTAVCR